MIEVLFFIVLWLLAGVVGHLLVKRAWFNYFNGRYNLPGYEPMAGFPYGFAIACILTGPIHLFAGVFIWLTW